jgi:hypothetical protein
MKAKALPIFYDFDGKRIENLEILKKLNYDKANVLYRIVLSELNYYYHNIKELKSFLVECEYIEDSKQYGLEDYWMEPRHFEYKKKGDCEDFALYTWKQLLRMGYEARFVVGTVGKKKGHAWCTVIVDRKKYIVDPVLAKHSIIPIFVLKDYRPIVSVGYKWNKPIYYLHYSMNKIGYVIEVICLIGRSIIIYPVMTATFLVALIPFLILTKIKISKIRYERRWT